MNNKHTKSERLKSLVQEILEERLSLRAICRIFGLSFSWVQSLVCSLWQQTPRNLGLISAAVKKVKSLQLFDIQADKLWSSVEKKRKKRWI